MNKRSRILLLLLCLILVVLSGCRREAEPVPERSDSQYIFVHGLSGWGSYETANRFVPYWGMFGGDLIRYLNGQGFSCYAASVAPEGSYWPIRSRMEAMFRRSSAQMGCYTGETAGSVVIDESWRENDGLVNTVSAMAPIGEASIPLDPDNLQPGIWQIFPIYPGDHMSLQGGLLKRNNIRPFYLEMLEMLDGLPLK